MYLRDLKNTVLVPSFLVWPVDLTNTLGWLTADMLDKLPPHLGIHETITSSSLHLWTVHSGYGTSMTVSSHPKR